MQFNGYIDLHIHTNNSDGQFSPSEIIEFAQKSGTQFIAISDHDSINGLEEFHENLPVDMFGIDAVEFSSFILLNNRKIRLHLLGYGFDTKNYKMVSLLDEMREKRLSAHHNLLRLLQEQNVCLSDESLAKLDLERYCWFDREVIKCLEQEHYSPSLICEYRKYFKAHRFSYGADYDLDIKRAIETIKASGGYAILAHPMAYKLDRDDVSSIILKLLTFGIDGIEVYQSDCSDADSDYLNEIATKYSLLSSVGSDFHRLINSDGRIIGRGIDDNLCLTETSFANKVLEKKMVFKGGAK